MIAVIVHREYNETTRSYDLIVSHGIDSESLDNVVLPQVHPTQIGAKFDLELGWILE